MPKRRQRLASPTSDIPKSSARSRIGFDQTNSYSIFAGQSERLFVVFSHSGVGRVGDRAARRPKEAPYLI